MKRWFGAPLAALAMTAVLPGAASAQDDLPLEPARTVHVDETEGTWMSVDVAPDGRSLVFDYLGDLFVLPMEGGEARQLTSGLAWDAQPRFGPDGKRVVFTSDRSGGENIWTIGVDGSSPVQVSKGQTNKAQDPEWSPDGRYIVASLGGFTHSDLPRLRIFHAGGGSGAPLDVGEQREKTLGSAFGPDPLRLWFSHTDADWEYNAKLPLYQIASMDLETGEVKDETDRFGSAFRPTLSPDGRWLAYASRYRNRTGLVLRELDSGRERWLAYPVQHDDQESKATLGVLPGMSFTPDSRHLVASYGGRIWKIGIEDGSETEIPFRVRYDLPVGPEVTFTQEYDDAPEFNVRQIRDATPSPDGSHLVFTALDRLYVSRADGSEPRRIGPAEGHAHFPAWSPDGERIAYTTWQPGGGYVWSVAANGRGEPRRLVDQPGLYETPVWSPDGSRVVFMRGSARAFETATNPFAARDLDEIVWVPAGGGEVTVVAPADGRSLPHFRPSEPDRIYLFERGTGLVSIRWDGFDQREHVNVAGPRPPGRWAMGPDAMLMSPSGTEALASINNQIYVFTVPRVGTAPSINLANPERANFPARRLTGPLGGEFPAWGPKGQTVHWSLGSSHFVYDLTANPLWKDRFAGSAEIESAGESGEIGEARTPEADDPIAEAAVRETEATEPSAYEANEFRVAITARRDLPGGLLALTGARLITMRGDEVIEDGVVVIRGHRIESVGRRAEVTIPDGSRVLDMTGRTILPGFVDVHSHVGPVWTVHRKEQWAYAANLAYGVTTAKNPQSTTSDILTYADLVRTGEILGPRVYSTGPGIMWNDNVQSLEEAVGLLRRYSDYYGTNGIKMYAAGNRKQRQWLLMAAREVGLTATTEGSLSIKLNLTETLDGYPALEHTLPIRPIYDDVVRLFASTGRVYTPTLLVSYGGPAGENYFYTNEQPYGDAKLRRFTPPDLVDQKTLRRSNWFAEEEYAFMEQARFVADLVEAGGRVGVGSHGQLQGLGYHWELWALASGGLPAHDVLRAATAHGAAALGLGDQLGSIEPGKLADLVVLDRNPLEELRNTNTVSLVMKNGRLYSGDDLSEIYPEPGPAPSFWWNDTGPNNSLPGLDGKR